MVLYDHFQNINEILTAADEDGVIVFCFGGNIRSADMSNDTVQIFYNVFSKLKQKIIWKWESDVYPSQKPDNVFMIKWIPQMDLLAQRQVKLFISHCGISGIYEALYHKVPILGIVCILLKHSFLKLFSYCFVFSFQPIYGDQFVNAEKIMDEGWAVVLNFDYLNEQILNDGIQEILTNSTYKTKVQRLSQVFRDRPLTPLQSVVYWIEYVIRYDGARHMQSPAVHLNFIQNNSIDVLLFFAVTFYIVLKVLQFFLRIILRTIKHIHYKNCTSSFICYYCQMIWNKNKN